LSEEGNFWIKLMERLFGVVIIFVGGLTMYYVLTSLQDLDIYAGFFAVLNVILIILGLLLLTAKTE
jgi:hypothetical protein